MKLTINPPSLHLGQQRVVKNDARFKVLACGRRWGKTRLGSLMCIDTAVNGGRAWWIAPSYPVAQVGWRLVSRLAKQIPGNAIKLGDRVVTLPTGGEIRVRSADNPDSLRGEGLDFVVIDECAFVKEDAWLEALRPALSDKQGKAVFISTPKGRNWFWRLWLRGQSDDTEWQSYHFPTSDNPYIAGSEIEAARQSLPEATFRQEYLAEFLENEGAVFRNIKANLVTAVYHESGYWHDGKDHKGHQVICGIDWAKQADFTVFSIGCVDCKSEIALFRFNQVDYTYQRARLGDAVRQFGIKQLLPERNSIGEPNIEMLLREGLPVMPGVDKKPGFNTTASTKPPLIENLKLSLEREEFKFLDIPVCTAELEAYEQKVNDLGRSKYSAPDGLHDDSVIARALLRWLVNSSGPLVLW